MIHTEFFVVLWLLPVVTQIIIPLVMLLVYLLVKAVQFMFSAFGRNRVAMRRDSPGLMAHKAAESKA